MFLFERMSRFRCRQKFYTNIKIVLIRLQPRYLYCASALENKLVHGFNSVSLKLQGEKMSRSVDSSSPMLTFCNINKAENKLHYKLIFQYYT